MKKKLIDKIEEALVTTNIQVTKDGWEDFIFTTNKSGEKVKEKRKDHCEWLDIHIPDKKGNLLTIHLYFTNKATKLTSIDIFKSKKKKGYKVAQRISL